MKLVMTYSVSDGYTYSCDVTEPFEYESLDKAKFDFTTILCKYMDEHAKENYDNYKVVFAGIELDLNYFGEWSEYKQQTVWDEPTIETLEEWFEKNKPQVKE